MTKLRMLLAFLLLLWGAPTLAQSNAEDGAAGDAAAAQDQGAAGAAQDDGADAAGEDAAAQEDAAQDEAADEGDDVMDSDPADDAAELGAPGDAPGPDVGDEEAEQGAAGDDQAAGQDNAAQEDAGGVAAGEEGAAAEGAGGGVAGGGAAMGQPWTFTAFDANSDGSVSQEEFTGGFFTFVAGETADQGLQTDNYLTVVRVFGLNAEQYAFVSADANGDGVINGDQEFTGVATAVFDRLNGNGDEMLSDQEFASGMLAAFDTDEDEALSAEELEDYDDWFASAIGGSEQVAGGGGAGGLGAEFFLTGDTTMVTPEPAEEEPTEDEDDAMQGDAVQDSDPADDAAELGAPGDAAGPDVGDNEGAQDTPAGDVGPAGAPGDDAGGDEAPAGSGDGGEDAGDM